MHAAALAQEDAAMLGAGWRIGKARQVYIVPRSEVLELMVRTNPFALVGRIGNAVREEKYLHGASLEVPALTETSVRYAVPAMCSPAAACGSIVCSPAQISDW